ncbi:hypothetical protein Pmani_005106 [Petrolisthes manimaculis]|uniref:Uncharacterized protein n=1 Tax=Petrolisthes manimaculis TaxID=1843537 RepID=A0AAE1QDE3_9EUCA|nr:hypothetical protein Pmani_005106 [Petrolisthes manimaculis]
MRQGSPTAQNRKMKNGRKSRRCCGAEGTDSTEEAGLNTSRPLKQQEYLTLGTGLWSLYDVTILTCSLRCTVLDNPMMCASPDSWKPQLCR